MNVILCYDDTGVQTETGSDPAEKTDQTKILIQIQPKYPDLTESGSETLYLKINFLGQNLANFPCSGTAVQKKG